MCLKQYKHNNLIRPFQLIVVVCILITINEGNVYAAKLNNVLIISIDALHPDALLMADIPTLRMLMDSGAYSMEGRSTQPPKTLIAHAAMFTGMPPSENGKTDNSWAPGQATVGKPTIFDSAKAKGFRTGYFYSKQKLGYLVNSAVDMQNWSRDNAIDLAQSFFETPGHHFVFLHVSGLDEAGPEYGWLSREYLEELFYIDDYISQLVTSVRKQSNYLIVVTSDHAGHDRIHGSRHPEDYRVPLIISSDVVAARHFKKRSFSIVDIKTIVEEIIRDEN
jgi:predicted AlkP superfamily pyrophosphatase or phosphodiesterase